MVTEEQVLEALEDVIDPELEMDFVSLGLIYDVQIEEEKVKVIFSLTTPACPIGPEITARIKEVTEALAEVKEVETELVFTPPWSPEMMTQDAKFALGFVY